jgi:hypothetical protein
MYADMMRRMQQKDVDKKKKETKAAIAAAADNEVCAIDNSTLLVMSHQLIAISYYVAFNVCWSCS